jgi:hypothetical protein
MRRLIVHEKLKDIVVKALGLEKLADVPISIGTLSKLSWSNVLPPHSEFVAVDWDLIRLNFRAIEKRPMQSGEGSLSPEKAVRSFKKRGE